MGVANFKVSINYSSKFWTFFGKFIMLFGKFSKLKTAKYSKSNLAIWSHWTAANVSQMNS